jgi:hypothetical protein
MGYVGYASSKSYLSGKRVYRDLAQRSGADTLNLFVPPRNSLHEMYDSTPNY